MNVRYATGLEANDIMVSVLKGHEKIVFMPF